MPDECLPSIFCSSEKHYGFSIRFLQQVFDDLKRGKKRRNSQSLFLLNLLEYLYKFALVSI